MNVRDGGGSTGLRGSDRLSPGLIRSSRRARSASSMSASATTLPEAGRLAGFFSRSERIKLSSVDQISGFLNRGAVGAALMCWPITDIAWPTNGTSPVAHS